MLFKHKMKYAALFALSFAVLTTLCFLSGIFINIELAPPPVAQAISAFIGFAPTMFIGALILGVIETFLVLWLYEKQRKWFWPAYLIIAILLGGLASFFSLWLIWILVALSNIVLTFIMARFLELRQFKGKITA